MLLPSVPAQTTIVLPCTNPAALSVNRIAYSVIFSGITILVLFFVQPQDMFEDSGRPRHFGVGPDQTLLSVGVMTVLIASLTLFIFTWVDMVFHP